MLNICIVIPHFFPVPSVKGGAVEQLATFLADENEKEHKINLTFISIYDEEAVETSKEYKYSKFEYIPIIQEHEQFNYAAVDKVFKEYMTNVEKIINENNFDYIIMQGGKQEHILSSIPFEKCITYLHGPEIEKGLHKYYKKILVVSNFIAKCYYQQTDTPKECIIPIENAIHLENFSKKLGEQEKRNLKLKYGITDNDIVINFCGRTIKEKGVKQLIQAFKQIKNSYRCKLLVVGNCNYAKQVKTPFEEELIKLAEEIKDKIIFTGYIPNKELYKIHQISDIAVIPSIFEEPFGLTVIEAMASELPLITSDAGAIPDIVNDKNASIVKRGDNFVPDLSDALDQLIENEKLRKQMGKQSKEMAQRYNAIDYYHDFCKILYNMNQEA